MSTEDSPRVSWAEIADLYNRVRGSNPALTEHGCWTEVWSRLGKGDIDTPPGTPIMVASQTRWRHRENDPDSLGRTREEWINHFMAAPDASRGRAEQRFEIYARHGILLTVNEGSDNQ